MKITVWLCWWQNKLMYRIILMAHIYTFLTIKISYCKKTQSTRKWWVRKQLTSKVALYGDLPADVLKSSVDIHLDFLTDYINKSFRDVRFPNILFPNILKYADVSSIYKEKDHLDKQNYRPASVLSRICPNCLIG